MQYQLPLHPATTKRMIDELERARRMAALARELGMAARILNGATIRSLEVVEHGPAPAWTDFDRIFLNSANLPADLTTARSVAVWVGAAMHEVGHTVFSPRPGSVLVRNVMAMHDTYNRFAMDALNILEDQRQERAMVARFAPVRGYFTAAVAELVTDTGAGKSSWPLLTGRTYLPADVRQSSRDAWAAEHGADSAAAVAALVGAYQRLSDPATADAPAATELVRAFADLLAPDGRPIDRVPDGCGANVMDRAPGAPVPTPTGGDPSADTADGDLSDPGTDGEGDPGTDGEGDPGVDGEGDPGTDGEGDPGTDGEGDPGVDGEGDPGADGTGGGAGTGHTYGTAPTDADPTDALRDAVAAILGADDVAADLRGYIDAAGIGGDVAPHRARSTHTAPPSDAAVSARDAIADTLADIRARAESGLVYGESSGRLNIGRVIGATVGDTEWDTVWDRFDPGAADAIGTECVLLVDISGSMGPSSGALSEAVWAIRHAADAAGMALTVVGFSHADAQTIATSEDIVGRRVPLLWVGGGTNPIDALKFAYNRLTVTDAPNRVLITLTDGEWSNRAPSDAIVSELGASGVVTAIAYYGTPYGDAEYQRSELENNRHGHQSIVLIDSLAALPLLFADIAARVMVAAMDRGR